MNILLKHILIFIILVIPIVCQSVEEERYINIGIKSAPPFVFIKNNVPSGFSIDLIKEIVKRIDPNLKIRYKIDENLILHLKSVENAEVDMGIAATTVTLDREKKMEFSQPFFYSGLGILVQKNETSKWRLIYSDEILSLLFYVAVYVLICAHLVWFFERSSGIFSAKWFKGISESIWWVIVTMSTVGYGDYAPKNRWGRFLAIFIIFSGIFLFGIIIASFSSALTLDKIQNNINSLKDTLYHPTGVIEGTTGEKYMKKIHPDLRSFSSLEEAVNNLKKGNVHAIIHDVPLLNYHIKYEEDNSIMLTGGVFFPSAYAICFHINSNLRKQVNIKLLELIEEELYHDLERKWFGK